MPSLNHRSRGSLGTTNTGAALRRGDLKISDPIPFTDSRDMFPQPTPAMSSAYDLAPLPNETTWPRRTSPPQEYHVRHTSDAPVNAAVRNSAGPSLIPSSMSSIPSKGSLTQKKPGGLRATLKRMFTSKRHRSAPVETNHYAHSDPYHLRPVTEQQNQPREDPPPPMVPVRADTALGSHSSNHRPSESVQSIPHPTRHARRNTLPTLVFDDREMRFAPAMGKSPNGDAYHEGKWVKEDYVSDGQLKRRSRSADALHKLLRSEGVESISSRDRESEIAYWRNSATQNPVPVYSGQSISVDPAHVLGRVSSVEESERDSARPDPMHAFDFGLEVDRDKTGLEQRVNTLEIKLFDFEYAIARLQGNNIPKPNLPYTRGSVHDVFPDNNTNPTLTSPPSLETSYLASPATVNDVSFLSSPGESPRFASPDEDFFRPQRASKATTATIRPSTTRRQSPGRSRDCSPTSIHIPVEKFEALLDLMKEEKDARIRLEAQVMELQKEVASLQTPVYATIREAYPTPSPESTHTSPATPRALHRTQGFQLKYPPPDVSRFSETDPDSDAEEGFQDVYETPREERNTFETARDSPRLAV
ncbi:hypothetical protein EDD37DRAFT_335640 [Exophiala viscosa]|uniref:Uncharacterized protein n=1 Tax=Exophiala viscosa TaxID=2486360 RepID=A0AAN6ID69_9EURO|nr:hypothetical protein EDD36DRAFT_256678 [Exophiala viscosa]KAI1626236.1 hypothetical protein EDD37DRAFT_335640 [Exophiala viscosa]